MGGAAASVLAGLFKETSPDETNEEREAKRNIITSLVTGIAAMSDPGGAAAASGAATANVDNNWLATQQIVQANKEYAAAPTMADKWAVAIKWIGISGKQDFLTSKGLLTGLGQGLADSGLSSLDSAAQLAAYPVESVMAMKEFLATTTGQQILGAAAESLGTQLDQISTALQQGGDANAEQLGLSMGLAVSIFVSALAGGQTNAAKAAAELSRMGIDLSSAAIKTAAAGYKAKSLEAKLAKLEVAGRNLDVPDAPDTGYTGGNGGKALPDFYTRASGETIPSTGYRYVSSDAPYLQELISSGKIPANERGTYFSFDNLESGAAGKLQVPHDAAIKIEFDTKQILDDVKIPNGQWGKADYLEPITTDFPQFGPGGATRQLLQNQSLLIE
ncbi:hypothetical protein [Pseudomonas sp. NPDC088444]|uniref:hypothetical protein n=1 Tax=Pseudomonas sp. NPDC088444 TaxID=3364456 RepID=UPI00384F663B